MLTSDLVRARVKGKEISPSFVDPSKAQWTEMATAFVEVIQEALERRATRGEVMAQLKDQIGTSRSVKVLNGLMKLLLDRCTFEVDTPLPPIELRRLVFTRSRDRGPLALHDDPLDRPTAQDIFTEVAEELGTTAEVVSMALYGDLKSAQVLSEFKELTPTELLNRYNIGLVQALLFKATSLELRLHNPSVPRLRQLLRFAKFHQLIHLGEREGNIVRLTFDGPASVLVRSTRYGLALAKFFPAVLLQECHWQLDAEILWTKAKHRKALSLNHQVALVSHYRDTGAYATKEQTWFAERWAALNNPTWTLSEDTLPIELGGHGVVMPDFAFTDGTRTAYLEIIGHWRRGYLERRVEALRRHGPGNFILAVSKKLGKEVEALESIGQEVVVFGQIVPPKAVLAAIERVAR